MAHQGGGHAHHTEHHPVHHAEHHPIHHHTPPVHHTPVHHTPVHHTPYTPPPHGVTYSTPATPNVNTYSTYFLASLSSLPFHKLSLLLPLFLSFIHFSFSHFLTF